MKRIITVLALTAALFAVKNEAKAQSIAHINVDELFVEMPELTSAIEEIEEYTFQLQKNLEEMDTEINMKYDNMVANKNNWTQLRLAEEEKELQEMTQKLQQEYDQTEEKIEMKQIKLLQPIYDTMGAAILDVARENGYAYVLDSSKDVVIFLENGEDILPLVKAKLGL